MGAVSLKPKISGSLFLLPKVRFIDNTAINNTCIGIGPVLHSSDIVTPKMQRSGVSRTRGISSESYLWLKVVMIEATRSLVDSIVQLISYFPKAI